MRYQPREKTGEANTPGTIMGPYDGYRTSPPPPQPKAGHRALIWAASLAVVGIALAILGTSAQGNVDATRGELLAGGVIAGVGGWLVIAGLITAVVGLVARVRPRRNDAIAPAGSATTAGRPAGGVPGRPAAATTARPPDAGSSR